MRQRSNRITYVHHGAREEPKHPAAIRVKEALRPGLYVRRYEAADNYTDYVVISHATEVTPRTAPLGMSSGYQVTVRAIRYRRLLPNLLGPAEVFDLGHLGIMPYKSGGLQMWKPGVYTIRITSS